MDALVFDILYMINKGLDAIIKLILLYISYGFITSSFYKNRRL